MLLLPIETLSAFFGIALLMGLAPGPDNLFVLAQSIQHGRRAGILVTLGLCTGLLAHTLAVGLGIAALLAASAYAFTLLKLLGAGYLLWLAWHAFHAGREKALATPRRRPSQLYRRGILMNLANPKVSIFFLAFLPQFVDPTRGGTAAQIGQLGALFIVATLLVFGTLALLAGSVGERIQGSARAQRWLNRIAALLFTGLALRLVAAETVS